METLLVSSPSLIMAEAMLQDDYKLSHPNLQEWAALSEKNDQPAHTSHYTNTAPLSEQRSEDTTPYDAGLNKKSEVRSVVIQVPPKRQKLCITTHTAREVVEGKSNAQYDGC